MKKVTAILLTVILLLSISMFSFAEDDAFPGKLLDMKVEIGNNIYTISGKAEDLQAQGIRFVSKDLKPGYWFSVDNGRNSFKVLLDAADRDNASADETFVCGYQISGDECPNALISGGLQLGVTTCEQVNALYGEAAYTSSNYDGSVYGVYHLARWYVNAEFSFESDKKDAVLTKVEVSTSIPYTFGTEVSELAGKEDNNLPDPSGFSFDQFILDGKFYDGHIMARDLLGNGWRVDTRNRNEQYEAQGDSWFIFTNGQILFNGKTMITVYPYNSASEGTCSLEEADVLTIGVGAEDATSIVLADGITILSPFEDVVKTFGSNYEETPREGYTEYKYKVAHSQYTFNVTDGIVYYIAVSP